MYLCIYICVCVGGACVGRHIDPVHVFLSSLTQPSTDYSTTHNNNAGGGWAIIFTLFKVFTATATETGRKKYGLKKLFKRKCVSVGGGL
jgi:hypothetical protein